MENVAKIISRLAAAGVEVYLSEEKLKARSLKGGLSSEMLNLIKTNKPRIVEYLGFQSEKKTSENRPKIIPIERNSKYLLTSYAQQRLWFISQMDAGSSHYNMSSAMRLNGDFKVEVAQQAFIQTIQRHEPLRTVFVDGEEGPYQVIKEHFDFKINQTDLSHLEMCSVKQNIQRAIKQDAQQPYDLSNDLMLRVNYLHLDDQTGVLLFNLHHIASDGWSMGVLVDEFVKRYSALINNKDLQLKALAIQYADYAFWQRQWLTGEVMENQLCYWDKQLADLPPVHGLPLDYERPEIQKFNGASHKFHLSPKVLEQLNVIALKNQVTLFMLIHAAFSILIARYSNNSDVVIGTPVANRLQKELEPLIGFFVNTLVLRVDCSQNPKFIDFLEQVKQINMNAQSNQDVPFEHLVDRLNPKRSTNHNALFQIMLSMNTNETFELNLPGVSLSPEKTSNEVKAQFDIVLIAAPVENDSNKGLTGTFLYDTDLFKPNTIERLAESMVLLLTGIAEDVNQHLSDLPLISKPERHHLLHTLNETEVSFPAHMCVHLLFEQQVVKTPNNVAVVYGEKSLTYAELNSQANGLAHHLIEQGIMQDDIVGICFERSLEMIISMVAILKSGAAYLPLDTKAPQARLEHMIKDSDLSLVITQQAFVEIIERHPCEIITLDNHKFIHYLSSKLSTNISLSNLTSENLVYVIYTSGTSGLPKGVLTTHKALNNLSHWHNKEFKVSEHTKATQLVSIGFDPAATEIWPNLICGAQVHLLSDEIRISPIDLLNYIHRNKITHCILPTALLETYFNYFDTENETSLEVIMTGGEKLTKQKFKHSKTRLVNLYGPTESTVVATQYVVQSDKYIMPPIGKPIDNIMAYVLSDDLSLAPFKTTGELYIGGAGLARGYLNRPELTAERFIQHNFSDDGIDTRLYRTGDLVRYLEDGNLEFIGRIDNQVKIRGFRIELGEIEHHLNAHPAVKKSLVVAHHADGQNAKLVAYFTANSTSDKSKLITEILGLLAEQLPDYMMPSICMHLEEFPLTVNGKIDHKALPEPEAQLKGAEYISPIGKVERGLCEIWSKLLKLPIESISSAADFFELGGHSLLSIRLMAEIGEKFDCKLAVRDIFNQPQLSDLAILIKSSNRFTKPNISKIKKQNNKHLLSYAQQRLWFIDQMDGGSAHYNMPSAMRIEGDFKIAVARKAFEQIIQRHETLRTVFITDKSGSKQVINEKFEFKISQTDLRHLAANEQQPIIQMLIKQDKQQAFNLSEDLMLRVSYLRLETNVAVMLFNMHHIASDGWSIGILTDEFLKLYHANLNGLDNPLKPLAIQYADYAHWQHNWLQGDNLEKQRQYWDQQLAELPQVHSLPLDFERPKYQTFNGASHAFNVDHKITEKLITIALDNQVTVFMLIHAVFSILIARYSNHDDVVIGTPVANRMQKELQPLIGFFVNTLVLRADCSNNPRFVDFLKQIKNTNLDAQANQDVPFEFLVDRLNPARSPGHQALFQIMLNMNTNEKIDFNLPDLLIEPAVVEHEVAAKFDLTLTAHVNDREKVNGEIQFSLQYNTDLFAADSVVRFAESLILLLTSVTDDPTERIGDLAVISDAETNYLLHQLNSNQVEYPRDLCVHQLFEQQVEITPMSPAVVCGNQSISYCELNDRANQMAHFLSEQGIQPGLKVGVCFERSIDLIVAQVAVFKSGGVYVPLDPNQPKARIEHMIKDSELSLVLTQTKLVSLTNDSSTKSFVVDQDVLINKLSRHAYNNPTVENLLAENLAYIIYTSGSTGTPKGVLNTHLGLTNLSHWHIKKFNVNVDSAGSHLASIGFDAALWEIWPYLIAGAKIHIVNDHIRVSPQELVKHLNEHHVTHSFFPTALLESTYTHLDSTNNTSLEYIFAGGEQLKKHGFTQSKTSLINIYGPTESSVVTTFHEVKSKNQDSLSPIGTPVDNVRVYVLSSQRSLVPFKSTGELYIAGDGLSKGYLNQDKLTAEKFIQHTFCDGHTEDLYQTGDLVRYIKGGLLDFVARTDNQIKLRGFRVEPGEVEFHLSELPEVERCVVLLEKDQHEQKQLAAYVVLNKEFIDSQGMDERIKNKLKSFMPEYMVPSYLTLLDDFPLTANGKVDSHTLSAMTKSVSTVDYVPPTSKAEKALVSVLSSELQLPIEDISMGANFFAIGGHSLSLLNVSNQLAQLGFDINLRLFYECKDLQEICQKYRLTDSSVLADTLVKLNNNQGRTALYLFHPMAGRADCYQQLALELEAVVPVIGVQAPFVCHHDFRFDDLNELTQLYAQAILDNQPEGPYRLGGWSIGGLLAQKVVEVLNAACKEVEYFVGIDCFMEIPAMQKNTQLEALCEAVAFASGNNDKKQISALLDEVADLDFEQQLNFAMKIISQTNVNRIPEDYLVGGLKFGVDVFKANFTMSKQRISKQATLLIAAENNDQELLLKGWHNALEAQTIQKEINGQHLHLLEGRSFEQIVNQLSLDMAGLIKK